MTDGVTMNFNDPDHDGFSRLGGAVVYCWDELPPEVQKMLLSQSALIGDGAEGLSRRGESVADVERRTLGLIQRWKKSTYNNKIG